MKQITTLLVILYLLVNATNAQAQTTRVARALDTTRQTDLLPPAHVKRAPSKPDCESIGWIIEVEPYRDNPYQSETWYADYLSDVQWYFEQYPNACHFVIAQQDTP